MNSEAKTAAADTRPAPTKERISKTAREKQRKSARRSAPAKSHAPRKSRARPKVELAVDREALKKIRLVAVAYSYIEREWFPTDEAYEAECEVETRAQEVVEALEAMGISAKGYPGDQYLFTNLLVDHPDFVLNLVDTLRGKDSLQTSVPAALELANMPYTGSGMEGLVIGNDRNLIKQLLVANDIPTPPYQFIRRKSAKIDEAIGLPLIAKLNESGGSVGIDNHAVKETAEAAQEQVAEMIDAYHLPVVVERFIDGREITAIVFEDYQKKHVFLGQKVFGRKPDGKHNFTSLESYRDENAYHYLPVKEKELADRITRHAERAYSVLRFKDYAKFDIRVDEQDGTPYFTDANPNTAFGPHHGLPFTEVLEDIYHVSFETVLASLASKYARRIET